MWRSTPIELTKLPAETTAAAVELVIYCMLSIGEEFQAPTSQSGTSILLDNNSQF
jgi:hypothetical protein